MSNLALVNNDTPFVFIPKTFEEAMKYADVIAKTNLVPKDYHNKPAEIFVAMQWGAELGLKPLQALQNIAVINGRPCIWGDAMLAIVQQHSEYEWHKEYIDGDTAFCEIKRKGLEVHIASFSLAEAKAADLLNRNTWKSYQKRMLTMRARAFALRNTFADALKGFAMKEEVEDYQEKTSAGSASINTSKIESLTSKLKGESVNNDTAAIDVQAIESTNNDNSTLLEAFSNSIIGVETLDELEKIGHDILKKNELTTDDKKQLKIIYNDKIKLLKDKKSQEDFVKEMEGE